MTKRDPLRPLRPPDPIQIERPNEGRIARLIKRIEELAEKAVRQ